MKKCNVNTVSTTMLYEFHRFILVIITFYRVKIVQRLKKTEYIATKKKFNLVLYFL